VQQIRIHGRGPGASTAGTRPCRPTRGTPRWSAPRRSPVPVIAPEEHPGRHLPRARPGGGLTGLHELPGEGPTSMHPYLLQAIARQREEDLRRAAQQTRPRWAPRPPPGDRGQNDPPWRRTRAIQAQDPRGAAAGGVPLRVRSPDVHPVPRHRRDRLRRARRPQIAAAGAVSEHFGAGQLVLVAHDASGPPTAASTSRPPARTLLARCHGKKRSQTMKLRHRTGGPR
jgi:hypothetical protein